ncbi:ArsR/SmtB family transcription factor [Actinomadura viridis]|uniref:DNA-binding transcriptional ArsR family regulator n=1 Tax=Actinomadura viridis TaxID=58110 RepID=A0A931DRP6_9ACTN|nr:metalloregulator ArsR/SmtB family transcription factor [Actinomadura viridis]MBG6092596.1 DNA-binding transcriptional ArsR family regulator [Actinomadura viridis]
MDVTPAGGATPAGGTTHTGTAVGARGERVFAALASPVRREVLRLLREEGPRPVAELASHFAMARPSFSEHLRVLREAGLVSETRAGRQRLYRLEAAALYEVQEWLNPFERFWREKLGGLRDVLDAMEDDAP